MIFIFLYFWVCDSMKEKTDGDSEREIEIEKKKNDGCF